MNQLTLNLTDDEAKRLGELASNRGATPEHLVERFVADLTHSERRNGSDESHKAWDWLERSIWPSDMR